MTDQPCPEFPFFGANYPDATCIDGFLWDLDSATAPGSGLLTHGGEDPCPFCAAEDAIDSAAGHNATNLEAATARINRLRSEYGWPPVAVPLTPTEGEIRNG